MVTRKPLLPFLFVAVALAGRLSGQELAFAFDPAQTQITFTLGATLHTVHGAFRLRSGNVRFNSVTGVTSGELIVDASSGSTDNGARDERMHKSILESARFSDIVFHPDHIDGQLPPSGSATLQVHGAFVIHGASHELTVPVRVQSDSDRIAMDFEFPIPYIEWGMKNPSTLLLRVSDQVRLAIHATARRTAGQELPTH